MHHRKKIALGIGAAAVVALLFLLVQPTPRTGDSAAAIESLGKAGEQPLPDTGKTVVPRKIGNAKVREADANEQKLAQAFGKALGNLQAPTEQAPGPRTTPIPADLMPRQPKLSDAQKQALKKLQWGLAKDLDYRGDGDDATVRMLSSTALAAPEEGNPAASEPARMAKRFVADNRALFLLQNPEEELVVKQVEPDAIGGKVVRMTQRYQGLDVWPGQLTANITAQGYLTVVTGSYAPTPKAVEREARISAREALQLAQKHTGLAADGEHAAEAEQPGLKIFADKGRTPALAYDVHLHGEGKADRVFIDAGTGEVLLSYSEICHETTTVPDLLGQNRTIQVQASGTPTKYTLVDISKPMYSSLKNTGFIAIYDAGVSSASIPLASADALAGPYDPSAVSAAYNLGKTYDFFSSAFQRNSFNGLGANIRAVVRMPDPSTGGAMKNAYWDPQRLMLFFGSGDNYAAASDVVGHEYAHAVTQYTANLVYYGDSGALSESLSDILGESFERYLAGTQDWNVGTNLKTQIRSMKDPASKGQPATLSKYVRTTSDNGGVHTNSGIPNYAFYLLAEGLKGGGIGFEPARNIFYRALTTKLNSRSDFHDLRNACVQAATELHGPGGTQVTKTKEAFDAVEIFELSVSTDQTTTLPVGSAADSYLLAYVAVNSNVYLGRREAAMGDGTSVKAISNIAMSRNARASVTGNGELAVYISSTYDAVIARTDGSSFSAVGNPGRYNAAALSADGKHVAMIGRDPDSGLALKYIAYMNLDTSKVEIIDLYLPVIDGPNTVKITSVDEVDISPDGQLITFDGLAKTTLADGTVVQAWSIFAVDVRSKAVYTLAGPIEDTNLGNPAFAHRTSLRITFEADDAKNSYVFTCDLSKMKFSTVRQYSPANYFWAYPRFSAADNYLIYTTDGYSTSLNAWIPCVYQIAMKEDGLTPDGTSTNVGNYIYHGIGYRRAAFVSSPVLKVTASATELKQGQNGSFTITRTTGDMTSRVPVRFKALGTAKPGTEYNVLDPNAVLAEKAAAVEVPVKVSGTPFTGKRRITLSLDPQYHYQIDPAAGEASIDIIGQAAPTVVTQPQSQGILKGGQVTFSVASNDADGSTYQWKKDGVAIAGATASTYTISQVRSSDAGKYTCVVTNISGTTTSEAATLVVHPTSAMANLSVRTTMAAGQTLIVGAVVDGGTKPILIRAAGPALTGFGLDGMVDPRLDLYTTGSTPIASNEDWPASLNATFTAVSAFPFQVNSKDAAISQPVSGPFTVQCKGTGPGVVLVEAYDVQGGNASRLVNVSARNQVGSGSDILITGLTISGTGTKQLLIRGVGPTLAQWGVPGVLADPKLQIYDSKSKLIAENDNWSTDLTPVFTQLRAFELLAGSKDAALLVTLDAGALYTVQVSGADGGTGEAMIEVYEIPEK